MRFVHPCRVGRGAGRPARPGAHAVVMLAVVDLHQLPLVSQATNGFRARRRSVFSWNILLQHMVSSGVCVGAFRLLLLVCCCLSLFLFLFSCYFFFFFFLFIIFFFFIFIISFVFFVLVAWTEASLRIE